MGKLPIGLAKEYAVVVIINVGLRRLASRGSRCFGFQFAHFACALR